MKKKILLSVLSVSALGVGAVASIGTVTATKLFAGDTDEWHHYAARTATAEKRGTYEYWVNCNQGAAERIVFEEPTASSIVEASAEEIASLNFEDANDPRWSSETLDGNRDVLLNDWGYVSGGWNFKPRSSLSLNLGSYAGSTITSMNAGEIDLGTDASNLDVSGFAANHSQDGEYNVEVTITKNARAFKLFVPTTFITVSVSPSQNPAECLRKIIDYSNSVSDIYGYYVLGGDILPSSLDSSNLPDWHWDFKVSNSAAGCSDSGSYGGSKGFHGTIDGRGHKYGGQSNANGIFVAAKDATVKNIEFVDYKYDGAVDHSMFGNYIRNTNFVNCTFTLKQSGCGSDDVDCGSRYGWIASYGTPNCTFTNCTFDASGLRLYTLLGTAIGGSVGGTKMSGCELKVQSIQHIATHTAAYTFDSVAGLTVTNI